MDTPAKRASVIAIALSLSGLAIYAAILSFIEPTVIQLALSSCIPLLFIAASFYVVYEVKCRSCGIRWLFKGANTGAGKTPDFQSHVKQGKCPYCGEALF